METASLRRNIDIHKKNIKELATVLRIFVARPTEFYPQKNIGEITSLNDIYWMIYRLFNALT